MSIKEMSRFAEAWWEAEESEIHESVTDSVRYLLEHQNYRKSDFLHYLRLYSNRRFTGLTGRQVAEAGVTEDKIKFNVVKSCIDASVAQIGAERSKVQYLPVTGPHYYKNRKKAERLTKFVNGLFHSMDIYRISLDVFRDAGIFGTGFIKITQDVRSPSEIFSERVFPWEVLVDDDEGAYGKPRSMFHIKDVSKRWLVSQWPEYTAEIMGAERIGEETYESQSDQDEMCTIIEAWHLPSYKDAEDGKHFFGTTNCTMACESWEHSTFPIIPFHWGVNPCGFYGLGVAEELFPIQLEINYIAQKIQKLMTLATTQIWVQKGTNVGQISNKDMAIHTHTGQVPSVLNISSISGEFFSHLDRLVQRAYELTGISQLSAQAKKPAGLDSGEALRVYNDIGSQRFLHTGQRWQQWFMDVGDVIIATASDMNRNELSALAQGDRDVEKIQFGEVHMEKGTYSVRPWPANLLPDTPAGKVEAITKLSQADPRLVAHLPRLLTGIPDIDSVVSLLDAPQDLAEMYVSLIIDEGKNPESPFPDMDLTLTRQIAQMALLKAIKDKIPEERIEKLRSFISQIDQLQEAAMPPPMPMGPGGPAGPAGPEGAPPGPPTPGTPPPLVPEGDLP